jgi:ATP phosphoribosyltransferase regulatory subunit
MLKRFRYPTGVRPLLVAEAARRRRVETRLVSLLERAGFDEVLLPIIDYAEPYAALADRETVRQSYRFVDREGELVAIRSDFTPMVARALASTLVASDLPLRIFYRGDVIRCEASRLGVNREIFQIGAEVIGDASVAADVDLLLLAAGCLGDFGGRPHVVYSDASLLERLIASSATPATARDAVRTALLSKRAGELEPIRAEVRDDAYALITALTAGTASLDDVAAYPPCADVAERLRRTKEGLASSNAAEFVLQLDDAEEASGYYTGLRFRVYGPDRRTRVAQGGRYDALYGRFGNPAPAIGFTVTIDDVVEEAEHRGTSDASPSMGDGPRR